jgi:hypothetical protein
MKTALAAPDDGPDKKKYGIPDKDKKGLKKKTEYNYTNESIKKRTSDSYQKKEDPDYEKFKRDYKAPEGRYNGYKAPDGSWHGSPGSESAIKAHYKWSKMNPDDRKKARERNESERQMSGRKISAPKDKPKTKPDPKSPEAEKSMEAKKKLEARRKAMQKAEPPTLKINIKKDYKVVENKIKKPEDKEKANKLKKTASRSKTPIRMKNKKAK